MADSYFTEESNMMKRLKLIFATFAAAGSLLLLAPATAAAEVEITFLANQGVLISSDEHKVMIDGFVQEQYALFGAMPESAARQQNTASGLFEDVDLALVSHQHFEHFQPDYACRFMQASNTTRLVSSRQVINLFYDRCRSFPKNSSRVEVLELASGEAQAIDLGPSSTVTVFPLSHGHGKFARLTNYGHLVELDGHSILHVGDAATRADDFRTAGLDNRPLDLALVPYLYFLRPRGETLMQTYIQAQHLVAVHTPPNEVEAFEAELQQKYPAALSFSQPLQTIRLSRAEDNTLRMTPWDQQPGQQPGNTPPPVVDEGN